MSDVQSTWDLTIYEDGSGELEYSANGWEGTVKFPYCQVGAASHEGASEITDVSIDCRSEQGQANWQKELAEGIGSRNQPARWLRIDPRTLFRKGSIIIYTGTDSFIGFFDSDTPDCYYIHTQSGIDKYRRIAPGMEVEEWPEHWWWSWQP